MLHALTAPAPCGRASQRWRPHGARAIGILAAAGLAAAGLAAPAQAQNVTVKPLIDVRMQIETLDEQNLPEGSTAATLRLRSGGELARGRWTARVEGQANFVLLDKYANGLDGVTDRPIIPDPANLAAYQAYLRYSLPDLTATIGRQEIEYDDARFVGTAPIRQNAQNFDALRVRWTGIGNLTVDVAYAWSFRSFWGRRGSGSRPAKVDGTNIFVNIAARTGIGTLTGFAYVVDLDDPPAGLSGLSSQTYGVRLSGIRQLRPGFGLGYLASYARQSDARRNPNPYAADYVALEGSAIISDWHLAGGFEMLGADRASSSGAFQTPFSSGVKFLGLTGRFLPTPPDGVRDYYAAAHYEAGTIGPFAEVNLKAVLHHFTSQRSLRVYGNEVGLFASGKLGKTELTLRYADYSDRGFCADARRFLLQLDWQY